MKAVIAVNDKLSRDYNHNLTRYPLDIIKVKKLKKPSQMLNVVYSVQSVHTIPVH